MGYILVLFIIFSLSGALAIAGNRKIEETAPVSIMLIISFLYFCGLFFRNIPLGIYLAFAFSIVAFLYLLYIFIKKRACLYTHCFTPGLLLLLGIFFWMFVINLHRIVSVWDEMSHWALAVKNMCFFDDFAFIEEANTTYKGYPPAIALWEYFVCKLTGGYSESAFYNAHSWFLLSLCLPICKQFSWKQLGYAATSAFFLILFPLAVNNTYMVVGYVDVPLGILSSYIIFQLFTLSQRNWYHYFALFLSINTLCLIKATGVTFAIIILALLLSDIQMDYRAIYSSIVCALGILIGKFSWTFLLKASNVSGAWNTSNFNLTNLSLFLQGKGESYWYQATSNFAQQFFFRRYGNGIIGISIFFWTLLLVASLLFISRKLADKGRIRRYYAILLTGEAIYTVGLLCLYIFTFTEYEALVLASFSRYMLSYMIILLFFVFQLLFSYIGKELSIKWDAILVVILFCGLFCVVPFKQLLYTTVQVADDWKEEQTYRSYYKPIHWYDSVLDYTKDKLAIVAQGDYGLSYYTIKYEITPVKVVDFWSLGDPYTSVDFYSRNYTSQEWLTYLTEQGCTYVYLHQLNDYFIANHADAFENEAQIETHALYSIEKNATGLFLRPVALY